MFEVYTYGNNQALVEVFNGVAALMSSDNYLGLIKVVALLALLATAIIGMAGRFGGFHWMINLALVYLAIFVPRADVVVVDRLTMQPPAVIGNVPLGYALFAHVTSKIGEYLTTAFETVFSLPNEMKYRGNGVLFGNRLIAEARAIVIADAQLKKDMYNFIRNCTMYDLLELRIDMSTLKQSTNIWGEMQNTSLARVTPVGPNQVIMACADAWWNLNERLNMAVERASRYYGRRLNPHITSDAAAAAAFNSQLEVIYSQLTGWAPSASQAIAQNMMINAFAESGQMSAAELSDPAGVQVAWQAAQAQAVQNNAYLTMAKLAAEALPKFRNVIEVVILAVFPFVFLLFLLPVRAAAMAIKSYIFTLLWVQLWPPLYAVLNLVMSLETERSLKAQAALSNGLSMQSAADIGAVAVSDLAVAGYLVISIPVIAYALIKGGEVAMSSVAGSLMAPAQSAAQQAAASVATGNFSYGNVAYQTESAFTQTGHKYSKGLLYQEPNTMQHQSAAGDTFRDTNTGLVTDQVRLASSPISAGLDFSRVKSYERRAEQSYAVAFDQAYQRARQRAGELGSGEAFQFSAASAEDKLASVRAQLAEKLAKTYGHERANIEAAVLLLQAGGQFTPGIPGVGSLNLGATGETSDTDNITHRQSKQLAIDELKAHGIDSTLKFGELFEKSKQFQDFVRRIDGQSNQIGASLHEAKTQAATAREMRSEGQRLSVDGGRYVQEAGRDLWGEGWKEVVARDPAAAAQQINKRINDVIEQKALALASADLPSPQFWAGQGEARAAFNNVVTDVDREARAQGMTLPGAPDRGIRQVVEKNVGARGQQMKVVPDASEALTKAKGPNDKEAQALVAQVKATAPQGDIGPPKYLKPDYENREPAGGPEGPPP